jgi:hypothetical protein
MQRLWQYLKNALIQFRKSLKENRWAFHQEELWNIFDLSETKAEAIAKRNDLTKEKWWQIPGTSKSVWIFS